MQHHMLPEAEAAAHCGVSPRTMQKWRVVGGGPVFVKLGRSVRYALADLETFLTQRRRASTADLSGRGALASDSNVAGTRAPA